MGGARAERIEALIDRFAAAVFAGAVALTSFVALRGMWPLRQVAVISAIASGLAFWLCARALRSIAPETRRFDVAAFEVAAIKQSDLDELLLTEQVELLLTEQAELVLTEAHRLKPVKPDE